MTFYAHTAPFSHPRPADGRGAGGEGWQRLCTPIQNVAALPQQPISPTPCPLRLERGEGGVRCRIQAITPIVGVAANFSSSVLKPRLPEVTYAG